MDSDNIEYNRTGTPVGDINPVLILKGVMIARVTVVYMSNTLVLIPGQFEHNPATQTLTIKDRTLIAKPVHLDKMRLDLRGKYLQIKDIDLSGYTGVDGQTDNLCPIGGETPNNAQFRGSYDGDVGNGNTGYKISSLRIDRGSLDYVGLFGYAAGGAFKRINIVSGSVVGQNYVGAIVGSGVNATISECSNAATITGTANYTGGICGDILAGQTVSGCFNAGTINGTAALGGIAGENSGSILGCANISDITATGQQVGGIAGNNYGAVSACYNIGGVSGAGDLYAVALNGTITSCYFGGSASNMPEITGTTLFGDGAPSGGWPTEFTPGWSTTDLDGYWGDLGGWSAGAGGTPLYPTLK